MVLKANYLLAWIIGSRALKATNRHWISLSHNFSKRLPLCATLHNRWVAKSRLSTNKWNTMNSIEMSLTIFIRLTDRNTLVRKIVQCKAWQAPPTNHFRQSPFLIKREISLSNVLTAKSPRIKISDRTVKVNQHLMIRCLKAQQTSLMRLSRRSGPLNWVRLKRKRLIEIAVVNLVM